MIRLAARGLAILLGVATIAPTAIARNVDLSTVPKRATVQLTIYNSVDLTLVRETRKVTFKKGGNPLQFSWANTLIDPSSVELQFKTHGDKLSVVDTTFPHDKPQMLYWNVQSEIDGEATIEITYFTSGISWAADYTAIADADEQTMSLEGFVRVTNHSGEDYEDAQVRLIVGTVNLVEQIAELAHRAAQLGLGDRSARLTELRNEAGRRMLKSKSEADWKADADDIGRKTKELAEGLEAPKEVAKESLGEYFIYTVEGTETVPHGWSKRMRSFDADEVEFRIQYRYRPVEYGDQLMRLYLLTNNEESKLGQTPLPDGVVRVFRDNGRDGLSYLTAHTIKYVPIGDKIELPLGVDPDVIFELVKLRAWRDNFWFRNRRNGAIRAIADDVKLDDDWHVYGWDDHAIYTQRVRNYTDKPIEIEVRRAWPGHVVFRSILPQVKLHDYQTVQFTTTVDAAAERDHFFEVLTHQGSRAKQSNVTLEQADVRP